METTRIRLDVAAVQLRSRILFAVVCKSVVPRTLTMTFSARLFSSMTLAEYDLGFANSFWPGALSRAVRPGLFAFDGLRPGANTGSG